jgi:RNA polymerase sigma-70 factor (ECF subfamily)
MAVTNPANSETTAQLIDRAAGGDKEAWGELLAEHRGRLRRMVSLRLDHRLQGRIDASDVIQDAFVDASRSLADYVRNPVLPFFLWLRFLTGIRLAKLHRHHLATQMRDAGREISLYPGGAMPETSSAALAQQLLGRENRPSEEAIRAELKLQLQDAINAMEPLDREIISLRHFEQLSNAEAAQVLDIKEAAAGKRYIRALERLRDTLAQLPGNLGELLS